MNQNNAELVNIIIGNKVYTTSLTNNILYFGSPSFSLVSIKQSKDIN